MNKSENEKATKYVPNLKQFLKKIVDLNRMSNFKIT